MNNIAVKAFLRGAMQEDPSDEQIEDLIAFLQGYIKQPSVTREILKIFKENLDKFEKEDLESVDNVIDTFHSYDYFIDIDQETYYGSLPIDWNWVYEQLKS